MQGAGVRKSSDSGKRPGEGSSAGDGSTVEQGTVADDIVIKAAC